MSRNIITDTNIWYSIKDTEIEKIKNSGYNLILPVIVLNELYTSPNIYTNPTLFSDFKKAVQAILKHKKFINFIEYDPFEYILIQQDSNYKPRLNKDFYLTELESLVKLDYEDVKAGYTKRNDISPLNNFINEQSKSYKQQINRNKETKKKFDQQSTLDFTEDLILKWANDNLAEINNDLPFLKRLNSDQELLLNCFNNLLREVSKTGKKIKTNDWVDVFILTYVKRNEYFWTKDIPKQKLILDTNLNEYLFEISPKLQ